MQAREILAQARDSMNARRVFGEPIDRDGVTIVPAMRLMGGAGAGGGEENASLGGGSGDGPDETGETTATDAPGGGLQGAAASFGVGFGVRASPAGVYVIKGDDVRWLPAVEPERLALIAGAIAVVALLILRSMVKMILKR